MFPAFGSFSPKEVGVWRLSEGPPGNIHDVSIVTVLKKYLSPDEGSTASVQFFGRELPTSEPVASGSCITLPSFNEDDDSASTTPEVTGAASDVSQVTEGSYWTPPPFSPRDSPLPKSLLSFNEAVSSGMATVLSGSVDISS